MQYKLKHAAGFKAVVDVFASEGKACMQLGRGSLVMWTDSAVATYPSKSVADDAPVRFMIDTAMLSLALESVQAKDRLTLEWCGHDSIRLQLTHPSGRETDIDFPILGMNVADAPPAEPEEETEGRRISSKTLTRIVEQFYMAASDSVLISFHPDGIAFKAKSVGIFDVRVWHPTHAASVVTDRSVRVSIKELERVMSRLRFVDSVVTISILPDSGVLLSSRGRDGVIVHTEIRHHHNPA